MLRHIDTHSHLTESRFDETREDIIAEMKEKSIGTISIGVDRAQSEAAVVLAAKHENMWATIGQHPVDNKEEIFDEKWYQNLYDSHKVTIVAVGECGLDYYWPSKDVEVGKMKPEELVLEKKRQKELFEKQIDFAVRNKLPLMLHVRSFVDGDAHADALKILDTKQIEHEGGIRANFHFFTETPDIAKQIADRGFSISFPGVITFADLDKTIQAVSLDHIMSETDSPYAAPKPHRGELASPLMVPHIIEKIAAVHGITIEQAEQSCVTNAYAFFGLVIK